MALSERIPSLLINISIHSKTLRTLTQIDNYHNSNYTINILEYTIVNSSNQYFIVCQRKKLIYAE
jgi:hypothetical protein